MENSYWTTFLKVIAYFNIFIVTVVLLDYFFTSNNQDVKIYQEWDNESVVSQSRFGISHSSRPYLRSADGEKFYVNNNSTLSDYLKPGDTLFISKTLLFRKDKRISIIYNNVMIIESTSIFDGGIAVFYIFPAMLSVLFLSFQENSIIQGILGLSTLLIFAITFAYFFFY